MDDVLKKAYEQYLDKYKAQARELRKTQELLNRMAEDVGSEIPFPDLQDDEISGAIKIKPDQFFRRPLATCVTEYLTLKGEATPFQEIFDALKRGGFEIKNQGDEKAIRTSIAKNTATYVLIGENTFGLKEKYGDSKKDKSKRNSSDTDSDESNIEGTKESESSQEEEKE
jgi:hypothetical protein